MTPGNSVCDIISVFLTLVNFNAEFFLGDGSGSLSIHRNTDTVRSYHDVTQVGLWRHRFQVTTSFPLHLKWILMFNSFYSILGGNWKRIVTCSWRENEVLTSSSESHQLEKLHQDLSSAFFDVARWRRASHSGSDIRKISPTYDAICAPIPCPTMWTVSNENSFFVSWIEIENMLRDW